MILGRNIETKVHTEFYSENFKGEDDLEFPGGG
jgi:hypothetical protein